MWVCVYVERNSFILYLILLYLNNKRNYNNYLFIIVYGIIINYWLLVIHWEVIIQKIFVFLCRMIQNQIIYCLLLHPLFSSFSFPGFRLTTIFFFLFIETTTTNVYEQKLERKEKTQKKSNNYRKFKKRPAHTHTKNK